MDPQIITQQIFSNNDYIFQLSTQGTILTLRLLVKISKIKTDVYEKRFNSLKDSDKLSAHFDSMEDFKQYIKDFNNTDLDLDNKIIRVLSFMEIKKIKKAVQMTSISLQFSHSIQKDSEDELIQQILEKCSSKKQLSGEEVKLFLENIAIFLSEQKKHSKITKQEQDDQIRNLRNQMEANDIKCKKNHQKEKQNINLMKNMEQKFKLNFEQIHSRIDQKMSKLVDQFETKNAEQMSNILNELKNQRMECNKQIQKMEQLFKSKDNQYQQKQATIWKQLDQLNDEKLNKSEIGEMRVQIERISNQIENIQINMQKDINVLGLRLEKGQKLMEKIEFYKAQNENKMGENISRLQKKEKIENKVDVKNWVDPDCYYLKYLLLNGSTITTKQWASIFGRNKIKGRYVFSATFTKFQCNATLGIMDTCNKGSKLQNKNYVYYLNDCTCNVGGVCNKMGNGFKQGQKVTVTVDLKEGSINWRVGSQMRHKEIVPMLRDNSISWVPYIRLSSKDDSVETSQE